MLEVVGEVLSKRGAEHSTGLPRIIDRIARAATVIPLDAAVTRHSLDVKDRYNLGAQDAVVFASIDLFLDRQGAGPRVFANRDSEDFGKDTVLARLAEHQ